MIRFIIRLLRFFRPLFLRSGIQPEQMEAIVQVKLTIDNRIDRSGRNKHHPNHTLIKQVLLMSILGSFLFLMIYLTNTLAMSLLVFHSYLTLTVILSFMSEYARLLFDSNDNHIIERFPVNGRTVLFARIISMLAYLYLLTLGLALFPYLIITFREGLAEGQLFLLSTLLNTLFSLLLANLFYIGLMHFFSAEKFQKIITYLQTILAVGVFLGYQQVSKMAHTSIDITSPASWLFFTPPAYFMAFTEMYHTPGFYPFLLSGCGLLLILLLLIVTLYCFSDAYVQQASSLDKANPSKKIKTREKAASFFARLLCRDILQQSGFFLTWRMTRENLKFKQSVLPMFIYGLIFSVMPLYQLFTQAEKVQFGDLLLPLYILPFMCVGIMMNLGYSDQNNLLWIYQARPLEHAGNILLGAFKAIYIKYFLPFLIGIYLFYSIFMGLEILLQLLLSFSFSTLFLLVFYYYSNPVFPFSKEKSTHESGGIFLKTIGTMLLLGVVGLSHYLLTLVPFGVICAIPVCWILIILQAQQLRNLNLKQLEGHY